jgi:hypothetical protein
MSLSAEKLANIQSFYREVRSARRDGITSNAPLLLVIETITRRNFHSTNGKSLTPEVYEMYAAGATPELYQSMRRGGSFRETFRLSEPQNRPVISVEVLKILAHH